MMQTVGQALLIAMGSLGSLEAGKCWGTRAKGDFPFEISPLCFFRFFEDLIRYQIAAGCGGAARKYRSEDAGFVTRKTARSATEETCYGTNDCGYHRTDQQVREG